MATCDKCGCELECPVCNDAADEIERLRRHKQDLNKTIILMRTQLEKRTACLVEAVGLAQESIMPFPNHYNCWRVALGWEPTQVEEK